MGNTFAGFETKSATEIMELLDVIAKKGPSDEVRFLAWVISQYVTIEE